MSVYVVVKKLVGEIRPIGESNVDAERLNNLKEMCQLVEVIIGDIVLVSQNTKRHEHSMKTAGEYATNFLNETLLYDDNLH